MMCLENRSFNGTLTRKNGGQNVFKMQKLERLILILCIWMTIICAIIVYGWYPTKSTNSKPIGEQNSVLHQEIDELQNKIAKMVEEVNARKALEKLHIQSIEELRATIQQQAEEISQMVEEGNCPQLALTKILIRSIDELRVNINQIAKEPPGFGRDMTLIFCTLLAIIGSTFLYGLIWMKSFAERFMHNCVHSVDTSAEAIRAQMDQSARVAIEDMLVRMGELVQMSIETIRAQMDESARMATQEALKSMHKSTEGIRTKMDESIEKALEGARDMLRNCSATVWDGFHYNG